MFSFGYVWNELRRRWSRTFVTALGLAAGVGLVMGIVGVSQGLASAQNTALSPLNSVGTDILVTRTVGATTSSSSSTAKPSTSPSTSAESGRSGSGSGGGGFFGPAAGGGGRGGAAGSLQSLNQLNAADQQALLQDNSSVITDLAKLGPAGSSFTHDFFVPGTLITFPTQATQVVSSIPGVSTAVGGLTLQAEHETGTVPKIVATVQTGGQTLTQTVKPAPLTAAQEAQVRSCLQASGAFSGTGGPGSGRAGSGGSGFGFGSAFEKCLPASYQQYQAQVVEPLRTISQIINPPTTDTNTRSYTVAGVDPASPNTGLITKAQLTAGTWYATNDSNQVLVNTAYANTQSLKVGSTLGINGANYTVVGLVAPTLTGNISDLYFPLSTLQTLSSQTGRVNEVLVTAKSASDVNAVAAAISKALPGAQVVTAKSLAGQVTGSLSNAHKLASRLGSALAIIVLLAAFLIAALLTLSSVSKRVREIGTLRAIGWTRGRVVRQVVAETVGIGIVGGVIGLVVGVGVCAAIGAFAPALSSTSPGVAAGASSLSSLFNQATPATVTSLIHLHAPIHLSTIGVGLLVAIVGGLIAGAAGGWRAARLTPVTALRDIG